MAYKIGELVWKITGDNSQFNKAASDTSKKAQGLSKDLTKYGSLIKTAMTSAAVAGLVAVGKKLVETASAAEETANKFNVTFSTIKDQADSVAKSLSENYGLSSQASQQLLADTGDLLSGFGFTQQAALDMSEQVNKLAVDLASFTNYSGGAEGASKALTSGLLGEREAMKSLGIAIGEADIAQLAKDKGIVGELDRQTKASLTLEIALKQSKNAIGDFARSQDSFANQARIAKAETEDLAANLGKLLLPAATVSVNVFGQFASKINDVVEGYNNLREAAAAQKEGKADTEDRIILLENEKAKLDALITSQKLIPVFGTIAGIATRKQIDERIALINKELASLAVQRRYEEDIARYRTAGNKKAQDDAEKALAAEKKKQEALAAERAEAERLAEEMYQLSLATNALYTVPTAQEAGFIDPLVSGIEAYRKGVEEADEAWAQLEENVKKGAIDSSLSAINNAVSSVAEGLIAGEDASKVFAKSGLLAFASTLESLSSLIAAQAAYQILLAGGIFSPAGYVAAAPFIAQSLAASAAAGVARGAAANFANGGIVEPSNTGATVRVAENGSGEVLFNTGETGQAFIRQMASAIAGELANVQIVGNNTMTIDGKAIAKAVTRYQRANQV